MTLAEGLADATAILMGKRSVGSDTECSASEESSGKFWGLKSMFKNVVAEYQDSKSCLEWFLYVCADNKLQQ